jgi:HEAT repeats
VRATHRPRLLLAVLVADVALALAATAVRAGGPRIEDVEDSLARDRSFKVRVEAALVLGRLRQARSVPVLIGALKDPFPAVRAASVQALGRIGSPIARDAVTHATQDPNPLVRRMAREAARQLGGDVEPGPPPAGSPGIRRRPARKMSFEVKGVGDRSQRAGPALRSHMRDFLIDQLRPFGDVSPHEHQGDYAVDGVIKDLSVTTREGDVEVSCAVQLMVSRQPAGGVFLLTSGEATVQKPKRQWKPQQTPGMQLEALEGAVRAATEDIVRHLSAN